MQDVHLFASFFRCGRSSTAKKKRTQRGIKVYGLSEYFVGDRKEKEEQMRKKEAVILLGYANMGEQKIQEAVKLLKEAWE